MALFCVVSPSLGRTNFFQTPPGNSGFAAIRQAPGMASGVNAFRVEIHTGVTGTSSGDNPGDTTSSPNGKNRTEALIAGGQIGSAAQNFNYNPANGNTYWHRWRFYVEPGAQLPSNATYNWHMTQTNTLDSQNHGGGMSLKKDLNALVFEDPGTVLNLPWNSFQLGRWYDIVWKVVWQTGANGSSTMWLDGTQTGSATGATLLAGKDGRVGVYHKFGMYRIDPGVQGGVVLWHSGLWVGTSQADIVNVIPGLTDTGFPATGGGTGTAPVANFSIPSTIQVGTAVTFSSTSTGSPAPTLQWKLDGVNTSTASSYTTTFNDTNAHTVALVATNASGSNTKTSTITAAAAPPPPPPPSSFVRAAVAADSRNGIDGAPILARPANAQPGDVMVWALTSATPTRTLTGTLPANVVLISDPGSNGGDRSWVLSKKYVSGDPTSWTLAFDAAATAGWESSGVALIGVQDAVNGVAPALGLWQASATVDTVAATAHTGPALNARAYAGFILSIITDNANSVVQTATPSAGTEIVDVERSDNKAHLAIAAVGRAANTTTSLNWTLGASARATVHGLFFNTTAIAIVLPSTPTNFHLVSTGDGTVSLACDPNPATENVSDYVWYLDGGTRTSTTPNITISGLTNGKTYTFRASAINDSGESAQSAAVLATPVKAAASYSYLDANVSSGTHTYSVASVVGGIETTPAAGPLVVDIPSVSGYYGSIQDTAGLVGFWSATPDGTLADETAYQNDGSFINADSTVPTLVDSPLADDTGHYSIVFDGTKATGRIPASPQINLGDNFTLVFMVRRTRQIQECLAGFGGTVNRPLVYFYNYDDTPVDPTT
jgi:PKD repeat protein